MDMKPNRFTGEQIIGILREQEAGAKTADVCRKYGISSATFYKWKAKYGGLDVSDAKRLRIPYVIRCRTTALGQSQRSSNVDSWRRSGKSSIRNKRPWPASMQSPQRMETSAGNPAALGLDRT